MVSSCVPRLFLLSYTEEEGLGNNLKLDRTFCTRQHLMHPSSRLQITTRALQGKEHVAYELGSNEGNVSIKGKELNGALYIDRASPHSSCEDDTQLKQNKADALEGFNMGDYFSVSDEQIRAEVEQLKAQVAASGQEHQKPHDDELIVTPGDFLKLDVKNWDNRDPTKVYFDGVYYDPRDPSFIKLRNNNFLKYNKALSDMYDFSSGFSLAESLSKLRGGPSVVFQHDNDFYRQIDFNTHADLQQKLGSLHSGDNKESL